MTRNDWRILTAQAVLGGCLTGLGRYAEAEALFLEVYPALRSQRGNDSPDTLEVLSRLINLYEIWGRGDQAARYRALLP